MLWSFFFFFYIFIDDNLIRRTSQTNSFLVQESLLLKHFLVYLKLVNFNVIKCFCCFSSKTKQNKLYQK